MTAAFGSGLAPCADGLGEELLLQPVGESHEERRAVLVAEHVKAAGMPVARFRDPERSRTGVKRQLDVDPSRVLEVLQHPVHGLAQPIRERTADIASMFDPTAFERIPLDFKVVDAPDLLPGHQLRFTEVGLDGIGIRVEYTITPAISRAPGVLAWVGVARDALGLEWEDVGGAFGPSSDRHRTEGVMTFELETDSAGELSVRLVPVGSAVLGSEEDRLRGPAYQLVIRLAV
jgi:hypothetical protein